MNQHGPDQQADSSRAPDSPARALASVVDNATALARAEVKLAAAETRAWLMRVGLGVGLLWLALLLIQVFALTLALTPVLLADKPWTTVVGMLLLSAIPAGLVAVFALRELMKLKETKNNGDSDADRSHRH